MRSLCEIAARHGTDKVPYYTPFYNAILSEMRESSINLLEVGIGTKEAMGHVPDYRPGASLRMWREFFEFGDIYGLDTHPEAAEAAADPYHGITTFCADSTVPGIRAELEQYGKFDVIVDDGDHELDSQVATFRQLWPLLSESGIYIVEDAHEKLELPVPHYKVAGSTGGRFVVVYA